MRSIFFAVAIAAIATISTGCTMSCKFTGPCRTLSQSCTLDQGGPVCTSCSTNNCNGSCGGSTTCNVIQPLGQTGGCDDGCPDGLLGGGCSTGNVGAGIFGGANSGLGMGMFQKGKACGGGCGDTGCDGGCGGEVVEMGLGDTSGMASGPGMGAGLLGNGCGKFGCGMGGRFCLGCKWRGRFGRGGGLAGGLQQMHNARHPYGGQVPHTPAPSYGGMQGGGGGTPSYSYPYYTTRGPRDFLNGNPPSIGR